MTFGRFDIVLDRGGRLTRLLAVNANLSTAVKLETKDLDFGFDDQKYLDSVELRILYKDSVPNIVMQVGWRDNVTAKYQMNWSKELTLTDIDAPIFIGKTAKFFRVRLTDKAGTQLWQLTDIIFWGRPARGRRSGNRVIS
mgnify:CR=1 FL=1